MARSRLHPLANQHGLKQAFYSEGYSKEKRCHYHSPVLCLVLERIATNSEFAMLSKIGELFNALMMMPS
jgi:hypothetical protein